MAKSHKRTRKPIDDPMHLQEAMMEAIYQTFQRGAMGLGEELAQHAIRTNPRLKRLLEQYAEAALTRGLRDLGVTPDPEGGSDEIHRHREQ